MENVTFQFEEDQLMIVVDLRQELGASKSGKSVLIATTGGNVSIPGHEQIKIGLNIYRQVQAERPARRSW